MLKPAFIAVPPGDRVRPLRRRRIARPAATLLFCDIVKFFYRKDPIPSSRREKCRRWGFIYFFDTSEIPDEVMRMVTSTPWSSR